MGQIHPGDSQRYRTSPDFYKIFFAHRLEHETKKSLGHGMRQREVGCARCPSRGRTCRRRRKSQGARSRKAQCACDQFIVRRMHTGKSSLSRWIFRLNLFAGCIAPLARHAGCDTMSCLQACPRWSVAPLSVLCIRWPSSLVPKSLEGERPVEALHQPTAVFSKVYRSEEHT